jgi:hypothetical protein
VRLVPVPFEGLLGNNCELKIIEFLMPLKEMEFNLTELAEEVNVSRPTVDRIVKKFVKWGLMKVAHTHGKTKYYALNEDSSFVGIFEDLNNCLVEQILGQEKLFQVGEYWTKHALVSSCDARSSLEEVADWAQTVSKKQSNLFDNAGISTVRGFWPLQSSRSPGSGRPSR